MTKPPKFIGLRNAENSGNDGCIVIETYSDGSVGAQLRSSANDPSGPWGGSDDSAKDAALDLARKLRLAADRIEAISKTLTD